MVTFDDEKGQAKLDLLRAREEEELARILSERHGIEYIDLTSQPIETDALRLVKEDAAREAELAVFSMVRKKLRIGVKSPKQERALIVLKELEEKGYEPRLFMVSPRGLTYAWDHYKDLSFAEESTRGSIQVSSTAVEKFSNEVRDVSDARDFIKTLLASKATFHTSRVIEGFIAAALVTRASDIHIEPEDSETRLRFRLDGILTDFGKVNERTYELLLSRLKIVSGLKVNVKDAAQDGRFSIKLENKDVEVRTSVIPSEYGESIVLRVLNPDTTLVALEKLGLDEELKKIVAREIKQPNGMVLTTGPTGSGKTTLLYALLRKMYSPEIKVVTIEDPIEYHLDGIVQTQTGGKRGYDFAKGLRSILRQDPDVIMVGEIRDKETATTAINASLTGHLVLSTLHTNNAAGAFPRLIDLGVSPKVIGAAVRLVMAQRLVRVLCEKCKKKIALEGEERVMVETVVSKLPTHRRPEADLSFIYKAVGCEVCGNLGYRGRTGVFEAIQLTDKVEQQVRKGPSEQNIRDAAAEQNILSMLEDGILKVLRGVTTLEEIERVVGLKQ